jgi:hypothetical protein
MASQVNSFHQLLTPTILSDLTLPDEYLMAKSHPIRVVLKLRPTGRSSPVSYCALQGYFIIVHQDLGPLIQISLSSELRFSKLTRVFWLGNQMPIDSGLQPFISTEY